MRVSRVSPVVAFVLSLLSSALLSVLTCLSSAAEYLLTSAVVISGQFLSLLSPSSSDLKLKMRTAVLGLISVLLVSKIYQTTQEEYKKYTHHSNSGSIEVFIEGQSLKFVLNNEKGEGKHLNGNAMIEDHCCSIDWNTRISNPSIYGSTRTWQLQQQWSFSVLPMGEWCEGWDTRVWAPGLLQSVLDCVKSQGCGGLPG